MLDAFSSLQTPFGISTSPKFGPMQLPELGESSISHVFLNPCSLRRLGARLRGDAVDLAR